MSSTPITSTFTEPPRWAVLQRELFDALDAAWRQFEDLYCAPDGSLVYDGQTVGRDGVDDFYEPFFNWPALYTLGGADDLLDACKRHWNGVTGQLEQRGMLTGGYENGYDWFHQGESLLFFYNLCAADPATFREQALRFADLFLPGSPTGNYDGGRHMMRAPHVGALGPRPGLGEDRPYSAGNLGMRKYGLPLRDLDGIRTWEDLADEGNAQRMADAMNTRLGTGDIPLNLAATSLVTNAWLYDHDERYAAFVLDYVAAWQVRAAANGGLLPDNVGPSGRVGELHDGRWYGGHYGWTWPHGLYSVVAPALVAALNHTLVTGHPDSLGLPRATVDAALSRARLGPLDPDDCTFFDHWHDRLGAETGSDLLVVPYRRDLDGWFDHQPLPPAYPAWLWWAGRDPADRQRLDDLAARSGYDWRRVRAFREKEEGGHEPPWLRYLAGDNPDYPVRALEMALDQVRTRLAAMADRPTPPPGDDIHWWQNLNPVVTEVLTQLIGGAPQQLYNGGLPLTLLRWTDAGRGRPGLPPDVAALVSTIDNDGLTVEVVNLSPGTEHDVVLTGGMYGEHTIGPSDGHLHLPPRTATTVRLTVDRFGALAHHQRRST
ncbi:hypothetical protein M1L60_45045 [Actinoplanes sp. TRM 88003]|uniref:Linalool dehydratase/isomerase domain-containing protein n=1 Tax=Paractinoplanes aksuensis TaxID=2939490 RepID=A0ABT1E3P5_9ACTN|nr:hypothetical protein [Actinoplanes aksuensis]MCO8277764.1 hypothetical protein [Actinoplanes aksuensis]